MLKNYLKIALEIFGKQGFSTINIAGLALDSVAASFLWVG